MKTHIKILDTCMAATIKKKNLLGIPFHRNKKGTKEIILFATPRQWLFMSSEIQQILKLYYQF